MAILCIRWNYFDMIRNPSPITLLVLQNCIIIHRKSTKGSDPYKVAFMVNKKKCRCSNEDKFHHILAHLAITFVTKKNITN